ncbi:MAG: PASTA domain-containing protein [Clostridia bacterium]|nr:PASTA domain-containing protein [Clostridia bacterium]
MVKEKKKKKKTDKTKSRLLVMMVFFAIMALALVTRIFYIQFIKGPDYQKMAYSQQNRDSILTPARGTIYDRNGKELAISISVNTITISPNIIRLSDMELKDIASQLADLLKTDESGLLARMEKNSEFEMIAKQVSRATGDKITAWMNENHISGVYVNDDTKRYYPNGNLAAHIIGFTGIDNQGLMGVEYTMEEVLKGIPGKIITEVDKSGTEIPFSTDSKVEAKDGSDVVLTIDENIQYIAETALDKAIEDNKVTRGGAVIVMDPNTGEILASVSKPDFDLNAPRECPTGYETASWTGYSQDNINLLSQTVWRNKALSDTYEPGSTFKAIVASMAIEENVIRMDTMTDDYPVNVQGWDINCWNRYAHGKETFLEGIYNSCNPVFVKVSQLLGIDVFYNYVEMFGFYDRTGIKMQGESDSIFQIDYGLEYQEIDMAVASFGQRFKITPIQLITAYSAIANGGYLLQPVIVKELMDENGNIVSKFETQIVRQVISNQTSATIREALKGVVAVGTGKNAYVPGYDVAGKTGTSETDEEGVYVASFCGFAPADNPVVVVLVVLQDPRGDSHSGGVIAAPVVGSIIEQTLEYMNVPRNADESYQEKDTLIPDLISYSLDQATKRLEDANLQYVIEGSNVMEDTSVIYQYPLAKTIVKEESIVVLYTYVPEEKVYVKMPNLRNKNIYEAKSTLNSIGLNINIEGLGSCISQEIRAGDKVEKGSIISAVFRYMDNVE